MEDKVILPDSEQVDLLNGFSDDDLKRVFMLSPWQYSPAYDGPPDPDNPIPVSLFGDRGVALKGREYIQEVCWEKFNKNPLINTAIRGIAGRLIGMGFDTFSTVPTIQDVVDELIYDPRNRLYHQWRSWVVRAFIEGELFLMVTCHKNGFMEVDFIDPSHISSNDSDLEDGIIFHSTKSGFPLLYSIKEGDDYKLYPSINLARYPELIADAKKNPGFKLTKLGGKDKSVKFRQLGGFSKFIVSWDRGFQTPRNIGHLRTVIEWFEYYELLKKVEIDHKRSCSSYVWVITIEDPKMFRMWLQMSEEDRKKTAFMAKKTPGGTMILPPGCKMDVKNPTLPKISETDTDLLHLGTAGLNEPEDVSTGQAKGTFASVKASRQPFSDRASDEIAYFERFYVYDFWSGLFFLRSSLTQFPTTFLVKEAVDFDDKREPVFKKVKRTPERTLSVSYPISEVINYEGRVKGLLGVKHGSLNSSLGISNEEIAKKLGFGSYKKQRLQTATESDFYPDLIPEEDQEAAQEEVLEPAKDKGKKKEKKDAETK